MNIQPEVDQWKENLHQAISAGDDAIGAFFHKIKPEEEDKAVLVEFALQVLEDFTKDQGYLTVTYSGLLVERHGSPDCLSRVRAVRSKLPPLPGLRDYRVDFDELILI